MANICTFSMRIRGTEANCESFLESPMNIYGINETRRKGTENDLMIQLDGECRWSVTSSFIDNDEESLAEKAEKYQLEIEIFGYDRSEPDWLEHFHYKNEKCLKAGNMDEHIDKEQYEALAPDSKACYELAENGSFVLKEGYREECSWNEESGQMNSCFDMSFEDVEGDDIITDETEFGDWDDADFEEPEPVTWSSKDDIKAVEYIASLYDQLDNDTLHLIVNSAYADTSLITNGVPNRTEFFQSVADSLSGKNEFMRCPNINAFIRTADNITSELMKSVPALKTQESKLNNAVSEIFGMERSLQLSKAQKIQKQLFNMQTKKSFDLKVFRSNFTFDCVLLARFALGPNANDQAVEEIRETLRFNRDMRINLPEYHFLETRLKSGDQVSVEEIDQFITHNAMAAVLPGDMAEYALLMAEYMLCLVPEESTIEKARIIALNHEFMMHASDAPAESEFSFSKLKEADKPVIAYGYMFEGDTYSEKECKKIERYISSHTDAMLKLLDGDDEEGFAKIINTADNLTPIFVEDRIQALDDGKHSRQLAVLKKYREDHFPAHDASPKKKEEPDWKQIYRYEELEGSIRILKLKTDLVEADVPDHIDGKKVKWIGKNAFKGKKSLKKVRFLGSVDAIEDSAFEECTALESIELPEGLKVLGKRALYNCPALAEIRWPSTLKECSSSAFGYKPYSWEGIVQRSIRVSPDCTEISLNNMDCVGGDMHLYIEGINTRLSCNSFSFFSGTIHFPKGRRDTSLPPIMEDAYVDVVIDE